MLKKFSTGQKNRLKYFFNGEINTKIKDINIA